MSKLTLRAQTVDIAYLPLRQDLLTKNGLMTAQMDFCLGNSLYGSEGLAVGDEPARLFRLIPDFGILSPKRADLDANSTNGNTYIGKAFEFTVKLFCTP